jgi:hypothetical protein
MRVAMAYETPIPLPGLPPPPDSGEQLVADKGAGGFDPGASSRLQPATAEALNQIEQRFDKAAEPSGRAAMIDGRERSKAPAPVAPPVRQALLGARETVEP